MLDSTSPITMLGVRARTLKRLHDATIDSIDALIACSALDLAGLGLDLKAIEDVCGCLDLFNLKLQDSTGDGEQPVLKTVAAPAGTSSPLRLVAPVDIDHSFPDFATLETQKAEADENKHFFEEASPVQDFEALGEAIFGAHTRKRAKKNKKHSDDDRAIKFADRITHKASRGPNLRDPENIARIAELAKYPVMDVADVAWLFGVSLDVVYNQVKKGEIPHRRFGDRVKILRAAIFADLFPDGPPQ